MDGDAAEAARLVMDFIWRKPESAPAYLLLARCLARQGDPEAARAALEQAAQLAPEHPLLPAARLEVLQARRPAPPRPQSLPSPSRPAPAPPFHRGPEELLASRLEDRPPGATALLAQTALLCASRPLLWLLLLVLPVAAVVAAAPAASDLDLPLPTEIGMAGQLCALFLAPGLTAMCGVYVFDRAFPPRWGLTPWRLIRYTALISPPVWALSVGGWLLLEALGKAAPALATPPPLQPLLALSVGWGVGAIVLMPWGAPLICLALTRSGGLWRRSGAILRATRRRAGLYAVTQFGAVAAAALLVGGLYVFFAPLLGEPSSLGPVLLRGISLGVGISFSFVAGDVARAPRWMQRIGLEWFHRLCQEPKRL